MNGRRRLLRSGFTALQQGRLIALLALSTAVLGVTAAAPLWPALDGFFTRTLAGDHVLRNHPTFAPTDVLAFLGEKSAAVGGAWQATLWACALSVLAQTFFAGGIVAALGRHGPLSWNDFFGGCRRNFWQNLKCSFLFAALLLLPGLFLVGAARAGKKLFEHAPPWSDARLAYRVGAAAAALLLYAILSLLYDFARAARRKDPEVGALRAYGFALRCLAGCWVRALGVCAFWFVFGGAAVFALFALEWSGNAASWAGIAGHTALQAAVIAARSAVRVGAWGSELALFDERAPSTA